MKTGEKRKRDDSLLQPTKKAKIETSAAVISENSSIFQSSMNFLKKAAGFAFEFISSLSPEFSHISEINSDMCNTISPLSITDEQGNSLERITPPASANYKKLAELLTDYANGNELWLDQVLEFKNDIISFSNDVDDLLAQFGNQPEANRTKRPK